MPGSRSLVEQQFGAHAAGYVTSPVHAKGASLKRLVELVKPESHWRALDVATAAGHTAFAFAPHVAHVTATDITHEMLAEAEKLAKSRGITNVTISKANAQELPFAVASFELVTCRIAPHHFPDIPKFVAEAYRVLKPQGTFALVDNIAPDAESLSGFSADELLEAGEAYNAFEKLRDPSHGRCLTVGEWRAVIEHAGFSIEHSELLPKEMEFAPWIARMSVVPEAAAQLEAVLTEAKSALQAFLKPRNDGDKLYFNVDEALFITRKPA